jgi:hypothetical protein
MRKTGRASLTALWALGLVVAGASCDPSGGAKRCKVQSDCDAPLICTATVCARPDSTSDAGVLVLDAGGSGGGMAAGGGSGGGSGGGGAGVVDSGVMTDAGVTLACNDIGMCPSGQVCNFGISQCQIAGACNASNPQPDTCGMAGVCNGGTCGQVAKPTCANFLLGSPALAFKPQDSIGPIITNVKSVAADNVVVGGSKFCSTDKGADITVQIEAYYPGNGTFSVTGATVPNGFFKWVDEAGVDRDAANVYGSGLFRKMSGWNVSNNGKNLIVTASFCNISTAAVVLGFYFAGGNGICFRAVK